MASPNKIVFLELLDPSTSVTHDDELEPSTIDTDCDMTRLETSLVEVESVVSTNSPALSPTFTAIDTCTESNAAQVSPETEFSRSYATSSLSHPDSSAQQEASSATNTESEAKAASNADKEKLDLPLYREAPVSLHATLILILAFLLAHNITKEALADLLTLLNTLLPKLHNLPTSPYKFYKSLNIDMLEPVRHYFCPSCSKEISSDENVCPSCKKEKSHYFLELPLEEQVKRLFQQQCFFDQIQHRFHRKSSSDLQDIYDGCVYKDLSKPGGILSNPQNLSLLWNTDGVPVFKSSNFSIWPIFFVINELPYQLRMRKQNILLGGLWFGESKPNMSIFLQPLMKTLSKLELQGTVVKAFGIVNTFISRVILLAGTCDLPAKSLVLNFKQFNGFNGCAKCLQPGETYKLGPRSHTHVYPFQENNPSGPLRTREGIMKDVQEVLRTGKCKNGVLGTSCIGSLKYFDMAKGMAIDYMHCCLLGVTRKLLNLMLDTKFHDKPFYIGRSVRLLDSKLLAIKPVDEISRTPRSLSDRKHWKASEYRSFLIYYSLPVLYGIIPHENFLHLSLLVMAMRKLLSASISQRDLELAEKFLVIFCKNYEILYGKRGMTINVHSLLHLPQVVKDLGPLWAYSCFFFEGMNGILLKHIHGTQYVGLQCLHTFSLLQGFPSPEKMPLFSEEPDFLKKLTCSFVKGGDQKPQLLGKKNSELSQEEKELLQNEGVTDECIFSRLRANGTVFHSLLWKAPLRHHNCSVRFLESSNSYGYGQITKFVMHNQQLWALVRLYTCSSPFPNIPIDGLCIAEQSSQLKLVDISKLEKIMYVTIEDKVYFSTLVDTFERD